MDYNSLRSKLILPEYGRNIQKMVMYIKTIEDREERNRLAKGIIHIMGNMNPHLRDVSDFKHKLWEHLANISNFELDIDYPYPVHKLAMVEEKPKKPLYKDPRDIKFMYYGRVLETLIKEAVNYPEGNDKNYLIETICNQMKKSFLNWNRESVNDQMIFDDLKFLSNNKLEIPQDLKLKDTKDLINKVPPHRSNVSKGKGGGRKRNTKKR